MFDPNVMYIIEESEESIRLFEFSAYRIILKEKNYTNLLFTEDEFTNFMEKCYSETNEVNDFIKKLNTFLPSDIEFSMNPGKVGGKIATGNTEPDNFGLHKKLRFINVYIHPIFLSYIYEMSKDFNDFYVTVGKVITEVLFHEITHLHQVSLSKINLANQQIVDIKNQKIPVFKDMDKLPKDEKDKRLKAYFSFKSEIDAFARQTAHELLHRIQGLDIIERIKGGKWEDLSKESPIFSQYYDRFYQSNNKKDYIIFKRYLNALIYFLKKDKNYNKGVLKP